MDFQLLLNSDTVEHIYSGNPVCVEPSQPLRDVIERMREQDRGAALVCRDGKLIGIFTERDALKKIALGNLLDTPIEKLMVPNPVTLHVKDSVADAISKMSRGGYRQLPVVDDAHRPLGALRVSKILHYLVEHFPSVVYTLPPAPHHSTQEREGA